MSANTSAATPGAALPTRRGPAAAPATGADAARQQLAWQREMERAQMSAWFKSTAGSAESDAAPSSRPPAAPARSASADKAGAATLELLGVDPVAGSQAVPAQPIVAHITVGSGLTAVAVSARAERASVAPFAEGRPAAFVSVAETRALVSAQPAMRRADIRAPAHAEPEPQPQPMPPSSGMPAPLRLHEELWPQGQAVWIAMRADDDTLLAMLPRIVADLQRGLQDRGQHLHQVVCNGRLVWREGTSAGAQEKFLSGGERRDPVFDQLQSKRM